MKNIFLTFLISVSLFPSLTFAEEPQKNCPSQLNHHLALIGHASTIHLCEKYKDHVILAVNTASRCGYTPQFEGLEALYEKYKDKKFVVLGFPSNDFRQELKDNEEIASFCKKNYGVSFPMFKSSSVTGKNANEFYKHLNAITGKEPKWNFYKYLIDRNGNIVDLFPSQTKPNDKALIKAIEKNL